MECARCGGTLVTALERTRRVCASCYLSYRSLKEDDRTGRPTGLSPPQTEREASNIGDPGETGPRPPEPEPS